MKILYLQLALLFVCGAMQAQSVLTSRYNSLRPDSINKEIVPYFDAGCEGENVTWDFSYIEIEEHADTTSVAVYCLSDKVLWDDNGILYLNLRKNGQLLDS